MSSLQEKLRWTESFESSGSTESARVMYFERGPRGRGILRDLGDVSVSAVGVEMGERCTGYVALGWQVLACVPYCCGCGQQQI